MSQCLKSINIFFNCIYGSAVNVIGSANHLISLSLSALPFSGSIRLNSMKRIGPHNIDILSLIIGSTLGDSHLEKRIGGKGTRVIFEQSNKNVEYLL
jgi:hypothetical protein